MTDKRNTEAQEAQDPIEQLAGQTSLFGTDPAELPEELKAVATLAEEIRNGTDYIAAGFLLKVDEIAIMAERGSAPKTIARACKDAAADAKSLLEKTGTPVFDRMAAVLNKAAEAYTTAQEAHEAIAGSEEKRAIYIDTDIDPALDPNSPDFDMAAWSAALEAAGGFTGAVSSLNERLLSTINSIAAFAKSETFAALKSGLAAFASWATETDPAGELNLQLLADDGSGDKTTGHFFDELRELLPFLRAELEKLKGDPEIADCTVIDLFRNGIDTDGNPTDSIFGQAVKRARAAKDNYERAQQFVKEAEIIAKAAEKVDYPLDKVNNHVWGLIEGVQPGGQLQLQIDTAKKGADSNAFVMYALDFEALDDLSIVRKLTPFDKRCYIASAALWNAGNQYITATQIYKAMGNRGQPKSADIKKINDSLTKMMLAHVVIDNTPEAAAQKGREKYFYDAALLPMERETKFINGRYTEAAIHLLREPPLVSFARDRKQITTIPRQLLESPISKTDTNLRIEDYLLERIGRMQSTKSNAPRKILFSTLYDRCHIEQLKQRQRTPEKIYRLLDYYKSQCWIKGYHKEKDGVTIIL